MGAQSAKDQSKNPIRQHNVRVKKKRSISAANIVLYNIQQVIYLGHSLVLKMNRKRGRGREIKAN